MRLVADIGGTNARFALSPRGGVIEDPRVLRVRDFPGPAAAIRAYLDGRRVASAVLAVATPVEGDEIAFTNSPWRFSREALRAELGLARLLVINDMVAHAAVLPHLDPSDRRAIQDNGAEPDRPAAVIAPGTGLGIAMLVPCGARPLPLPSEGGHSSFAPADARERALLALIEADRGHVSYERFVSGPGLLLLARGLARLEGASCEARTPPEVTMLARQGRCPHCREAVAMFSVLLGAFAGDIALTLGARGGIHLSGGLLLALDELFDHRAFLRRFIAKGRLSWYLERIPVSQITRTDTGLVGASWYGIEPDPGAEGRRSGGSGGGAGAPR